MKKISALLLSLILLLGAWVTVLFSACSFEEGGRIKIVTTVFPEYDWTVNILGEHSEEVNIKNLLNSGTDLHSYQPPPADIVAIATCDLFIYVGGESDKWVEDALKNATNKQMKTIKLLDVVKDSALEEEIPEGAEEEEEEEGAYDEHVWLSLKRAKVIVEKIAQTLAQIDPEYGEDYLANAQSYKEKLDGLDLKYQAAVEAANVKTLLFADRFPFLYLFKDYGLSYYAAFSGCSAETEASIETIKFLVQKVNELALTCILKVDGSDGSIAETVKRDSKAKNQKILTLNSLQSATSSDGESYLSLMEKNLEVLKEAME